MQDLLDKMQNAATRTEDTMRRYFAERDTKKTTLYRAMEYGVMSGGKRIRPFLTLEFCRMLGGSDEAALPYAAAIEMIHNFSLIHDDMPCMDNDDLRRGRPTTHKVFGEAQALLAGDALIFAAFDCALSGNADAAAQNRAVRELAVAAGADGMCEGQMIDMESDGVKIPFERLLELHAHKTGALIRAAARLGVIAAGGDARAMAAADAYGRGVGLAFQIVDDVLDAYGTAALGKPIGSDAKNEKSTFLSFMQPDEALAYAAHVTKEATDAVCVYPASETLVALGEWLLRRTH